MLNRRNSFSVAPASRPMTAKKASGSGDRLQPTATREVSELAHHLSDNPVFQDIMDGLEGEALRRFSSSKLGDDGSADRTSARYELEALSTIRERLRALAAELSLYAVTNDHPND